MLARHHLNMLLVLTKFIPSLEQHGMALLFVVEAVGIRREEGHSLLGQ